MALNDINATVKFYQGWLKKKPAHNWGGNFWGPTRTRCSIIKPEELDELESAGFITRSGSTFSLTAKGLELK